MQLESKKKFDVLFLDEASDFIEKLSIDQRKKVLYNIRKTQIINDISLLKKLTRDIWEFRTNYKKLHIRIICFRLSRKSTIPVVVCTHGIIKKTSRVLTKEIKKAQAIMRTYKDEAE